MNSYVVAWMISSLEIDALTLKLLPDPPYVQFTMYWEATEG